MDVPHASSAAIDVPSPAGDLAPPPVPIDDLEERILASEARRNAETFRGLVLLREFDERAGWARWGLRNCREWLQSRCDLGAGAAGERVRVAHALKVLPAISAAFADGRLSYSKVRALTRVATPADEAALLAYALAHSARRVAERCRQRANVRPSSTGEAQRSHARRELRIWPDGAHGTVRLEAELPAEQAELVAKALDKAVEQSEPRIGPELEPTSWAAQQADALVELARGYLADAPASRSATREHEPNALSAENLDPASPADRAKTDDDPGERARSENLSAETPASVSAEIDTPRSIPADHYQVIVHVDQSALTERRGRSDLPLESVKRLLCDGSFVPLAEDAEGRPIAVGRKRRTVSAAQRRALLARDGGCSFPGCTSKRYVEAHHVRHWADGGETTVENTMLLCSRHHRLVHEGGYAIRRDHRGRWFFQRPDGRAIPAHGYRPEDAEAEPILRDGLSAESWLAERLRRAPPVRRPSDSE